MYYANPRSGAAVPAIVALAAWAAVAGRGPRGWLNTLWPIMVTVVATYSGLAFVQARTVGRDPWNDTFTAKHLLFLQADLAVNEFRRDLESPIPPPHAALLRKIIPKIEREIVGYGKSYRVNLTFNENALMYTKDNPDADIIAEFHNDPAGYRRFCLHYYLCIVRHQPAAYFRNVWRKLAYYYAAPEYDGSFREYAVDIIDALPSSARLARYTAENALPRFRPMLEESAKQMERVGPPPIVFRPRPWFWSTVRLLGRCFLAITIVGCVGAALILLRRRLRAQAELRWLAALCLSTVVVLFAQELTLAMVTMTDGRYSDAMRTLAVFSLLCAATVTVGVVAAEWCHRTEPNLCPRPPSDGSSSR